MTRTTKSSWAKGAVLFSDQFKLNPRRITSKFTNLFMGIMIFIASPANATVTLNFDTLTQNSPVADAYLTSGVIFDSLGWAVENLTFGIVLVPSAPNYIALTTLNTSLRFVNPADLTIPATTTFFSFDNAGLIASSHGFYAGLGVVAKDINGVTIDTASVPSVGLYQGRDIFTTTLQGPGIHSIDFTYVYPALTAVLPIDNVQFGEVTFSEATSVPIPATIWLFGLGLAGLICLGRKRRYY